MAVIQRKLKSGVIRWQVRRRDPSGMWYPSLFFESEAEALAQDEDLKKLSKKNKRAMPGEARRYTVHQYWEVWKDDCRDDVTEGWKKSQDQMAKDYILPVIGKVTMAEVDGPSIGKIFSRMKQRGLSDQMRLHVYTLVATMFRAAVGYYKLLAESPVLPEYHRPKVAKTKRDFLRPSQSLLLLEAAKVHPFLGPPVWLETVAAFRTEATIGVGWEHVDWDANQFELRRFWKKKERRLADFPKEKEAERVPIAPMLKTYLLELWLKRGKPATGFICLGPNGGMLSTSTFEKGLSRLCKQAGVPRVTPHELRHSATELWQRAGANTEDLRRLLNHASASTTLGYIHRTDERLAEISQGVGTLSNVPFGNKKAVRTAKKNAQGRG
jgi:integrase